MQIPPGTLPQRVIIVGNTNSGKSTLARTLSQRLNLPYTELDALYWGPNWTPTPTPILREKITAVARQPRWVMDGNYSMARDIIWHYADTLIWLDFPLPVILYRLIRRSLRRIIHKETLWNGNRETWRGLLFSRDSLLLWALKKHKLRRREFLALFQEPDFAHLTIYRFRTPAALTKWVSSLP